LRFFEWQVWRDSKSLSAKVLDIVNNLPQEYLFDLGVKIVDYGFPIMINIAEGSGKSIDKDSNPYLDVFLG